MQPLITTEQIFDSLEIGILSMWDKLKPTLMPILTEHLSDMIVVSIISLALFQVWKFIHFDASSRETKRAKNNIHNGVDAVTSIFGLFKKDK